MKLYLFRHGYSMANKNKLVTGTPADRLNDIGISQAKCLGDWVKALMISADRYVVSHWGRAQETASAIFPGISWEVDERIGETDAGSVANLPLEEFLVGNPDFYDNPENKYPDGESHIDLNERVVDWLLEQLDQGYASVVAVTHSGPISCLLQHIHGVGMDKFPVFLPLHATLTVLNFEQVDGQWLGKLKAFSMGPIENINSVVNG